MKKQSLENIFIILISIGALCFVLIGGLSIWADFEASLFNSARRTTERLTTFNCPSFITNNEVGIISASFTNTSDREIKPRIQTFVTDGFVILMQEQIDTLTIAPGETESVEVKVTADNAVYNRLILARMHQFNYGPLPYRNASCGIFVLGISFMTGTQVISITVITGLILSLSGIALWLVSFKPIVWDRMTTLHEMIVLLVLAFLIMIAGLASLWLFGIFLIVIWLLLVVGIISQKVLSSNKRSNQDKRPNTE
jgi:hypothetical protein